MPRIPGPRPYLQGIRPVPEAGTAVAVAGYGSVSRERLWLAFPEEHLPVPASCSTLPISDPACPVTVPPQSNSAGRWCLLKWVVNLCCPGP